VPDGIEKSKRLIIFDAETAEPLPEKVKDFIYIVEKLL